MSGNCLPDLHRTQPHPLWRGCRVHPEGSGSGDASPGKRSGPPGSLGNVPPPPCSIQQAALCLSWLCCFAVPKHPHPFVVYRWENGTSQGEVISSSRTLVLPLLGASCNSHLTSSHPVPERLIHSSRWTWAFPCWQACRCCRCSWSTIQEVLGQRHLPPPGDPPPGCPFLQSPHCCVTSTVVLCSLAHRSFQTKIG